MERPLIIGIAGGSASGKTSIACKLLDAFDEYNTVIRIKEDDYYNDQSNMTMQERLKVNYDHPLAFDHDLLIRQLKMLISGKAIEKPIYDYVSYTRTDKTEHVESADVDTPADVRFIRRLKRDVKERERTIDSVIDQYMSVVRVMHERFIEPSKRYADIIIPEGGQNYVAIDLLMTKIASILY